MRLRHLGILASTALVLPGLTRLTSAATLALQLQAANYNPTSGVWTDTSGNGNNATYYGTKPTLDLGTTPNGSSSVGLNLGNTNGNGFTLASPIAYASGYTVFALVDPGTTSGRRALTGGSSNNALEWDVYNGNDDFLREYLQDVSNGSATVPTGSFSELDLAVNSSASAFDFNGASDPSNGNGATFGSAITRIGNNEGGGDGFSGDIAEIDIYTGILTAPQIAAVQSQLQAEYVSPVPEPVSMGLAMIASGALLGRRRRMA